MARDGCTILGCGRPGIARGMCWAHYQRARRGLPVHVYLAGRNQRSVALTFGPKRPPYSVLRTNRIAWRLKSDITPEPNTGCWLWLGEYNEPTGRPLVGYRRDPWNRWASRAVVHFAGVKLVRGTHLLHVRHTCNQPACVNPDHLVYGTAKENMADRTLRYERGELKRPQRRAAPDQAQAAAEHNERSAA